ncbi:MAG: radical SAM protein [Candidatus Bathyarchaeia archaeon]
MCVGRYGSVTMYDALARHRAIESIVTGESPRGQLRKYYRFRADRWYGGIATGDVVGCGLLCRFCWVSDKILEQPDIFGDFLAPQEAALKLLRVAQGRNLVQLRLSGGEPTLGRPHLLGVLSEVEKGNRFRFILETNGILLGADPSYCSDLAAFHGLHVRVSLKGSCEDEFTRLTGAKGDDFNLQLDALRNLVEASVSCHPAVMSSFSTRDTLHELRNRVSSIDRKLAGDLELEELIRYPRVERRLKKFGITPHVSHDPGNVPERLI